MERFLAAAVQLTSIADKSKNIGQALALIDEACSRGARFVALPENADFMGPEHEKLAGAEGLDGPTFFAFSEKAREKGIALLAGTIAERAGAIVVTEAGAGAGAVTATAAVKVHNTSVLFGPDGAVAAVYRKIHLFDVDLADGSRYRESDCVAPGADVVVARMPLANFGMSVCYDVRFPELYRRLSAEGAEVLLVPAAFTLHTGKDHWEVLLRARAIENTSYVIAPAQVGRHSPSRVTYGNSMIIDPWGVVLARCSDGPGVCVAEITPSALSRVRQEIPSLGHRRL